MLQIALASQSPRRRELLLEAGYQFQVFPVKVSEIFDENLNPRLVPMHLAQIKVEAAIEQNKLLKTEGFLVLTADTVVIHQGRVLGKPENQAQAEEFLRLLSDQMHSVITGLCLAVSGSKKLWTGYDETLVQFRRLRDVEIQNYIASGEPMDKAGAYGIQGAARDFVSKIEGSWSNVVGLPLERLQSALHENGWNVRRRST